MAALLGGGGQWLLRDPEQVHKLKEELAWQLEGSGPSGVAGEKNSSDLT